MTAARAKRGSSKPNCQPSPAAVPVSKAEWLEGMPPVSTNTLGFQRPWTTSSITNFESWAIPQAANPQARTPLLKKAWRAFIDHGS